MREIQALLAAAGRELWWGLRSVSLEVRRWRARAQSIPDTTLRADALGAIASKRGNINGAALFWTLPRERRPKLQWLLIAFDMIADFLDNVSERNAPAGIANGLHLHGALVHALDCSAALTDHYARNAPWRDDGGYLRALVRACRAGALTLPSYELVRPLAVRAASMAEVLGVNHEPDATRRDEALRQWAAKWFGRAEESLGAGEQGGVGESRGAGEVMGAGELTGAGNLADAGESRGVGELTWFELAAAASGWLAVLALLALACDARCESHAARAVYAAYLPWVSLAGTMLDSYADAAQDAAAGQHSYIAHYGDADAALRRMCEVTGRATRDARRLRDGPRHAVIVACMIALYLSKDSVHERGARARTRCVLRAGGPLARLLLPVLRVWRAVYSQRGA
ncbi:MAG TPA: DUF2600 family protein [Solirubrobacteraceae bacterium]